MSERGPQRVAIAGAGGMGREALAWLRDARPDVVPVAFFTRDAAERPVGAGVDIPVVDSLDRLEVLEVESVVLAVGDGAIRRSIADELLAAGIGLMSVVHPHAFLGPGVSVGDGAVVAPGCVVTRDVRIGRGAILNYRSAIGHDCAIGDFSFVGPGAVLTGGVRIGEGAFIGSGAVILPALVIGVAAMVGAGAVVTHDVADGSVVAGNPAREVGPGGPSTAS